ncbi:Uronyl 2-sulfotransferase [Tupaia chinensis]|uniref:Uronyl 2-sulfotransferase n=1 Tax=Tupaia chinensis TaxID=246437 RepID=L9JBW9_TUPCH|nr:Uronyl 2-sulfotransferase [Tupaia chinensis]
MARVLATPPTEKLLGHLRRGDTQGGKGAGGDTRSEEGLETWSQEGERGQVSRPWRADINECILENYPECSNPRLFYIIPYFCGQHPRCREPGEWALERAKLNVNENFLLVGILEELEDVLLLLERFLPHYFKGVLSIYKDPACCSSEQMNPRREPGEWALERAKLNVNENFLLVGILEELEDVLLLLERFLPHYFKGVLSIYKDPGFPLKNSLAICCDHGGEVGVGEESPSDFWCKQELRCHMRHPSHSIALIFARASFFSLLEKSGWSFCPGSWETNFKLPDTDDGECSPGEQEEKPCQIPGCLQLCREFGQLLAQLSHQGYLVQPLLSLSWVSCSPD